MDDLLFSHNIETVKVGSLELKLCMISDLDEALDHYVKVSPSDTDKIPYFTRLWESARVLAEFLVANPEIFHGKRALEVGCGLGLPSLCAAKLGAQMTASDFHPDNRAFFLKNASMNGLDQIEYHQMDWRNPDLPKHFELIFGSDLIYEKEMVEPLVSCVDKLLDDKGTFILVDPGRRHLQTAVTAMEKAGYKWRLVAVGTIWLLFFTKNGQFPKSTDGEVTFQA